MSGLIKASSTVNTFIDPAKDFCKDGFQNFVKVGLIDIPYTTIVKRAQMSDLSQDLMPRMAVERIMTQNLFRIADESDPAGEPVWGVVGDSKNQVRFVGSGFVVDTAAQGTRIYSYVSGDYIEVSFYGTGANILMLMDNSGQDVRITVDGGSEGSNIYPSASIILQNRNYATNQLINIASNLSLGLHTIKVRHANATTASFYGFEILNESSSLIIPSGSAYIDAQKITHSSESLSYNSGFESGTLGTKGGRVLTYLKSNGSVGKAVTPADSAAITYPSAASHANEEMIREFTPFEFSCGRSDDINSGNSSYRSGGMAFSLDDNLHTIVLSGIAYSDNRIALTGTNDFFTFTFYGTGLDIVTYSGAGAGDPCSMYIDGTQILSSTSYINSANKKVVKIASGLPLGTHTFKLINNNGTAGYDVSITSFMVYAPKLPTLPLGAVKLGEYCLNADFVVGTAGAETISTGVVRKHSLRESIYVNGSGGSEDWNIVASISTYIGGFLTRSNRTNSYEQYTFTGTGFDFRTQADTDGSTNVQVYINGLLATTTNYPSMVSSVYGGTTSFNSGTGIYVNTASSTPNGQGSGLRISGLPFGKYDVKLNNNSSGLLRSHCFDIITPIYMPSSLSSFEQQNTLTLPGSISDLRKLAPVDSYNTQKGLVAVAIGVASSPTTTSSTSVPCPNMSVTFNAKEDGYYSIHYFVVANNSSGTVYFYTYVDGKLVIDNPGASSSSSNTTISDLYNVYFQKGSHKVDIYWNVGTGTATAISTLRKLSVYKI